MSKATRIAALGAALQLRTPADDVETVILRAMEFDDWLGADDPPARPTVAGKLTAMMCGKGTRAKRA